MCVCTVTLTTTQGLADAMSVPDELLLRTSIPTTNVDRNGGASQFPPQKTELERFLSSAQYSVGVIAVIVLEEE